MALIKAKARQTDASFAASEGDDVFARAMRDGSLYTNNWFMAQAIKGRAFGVNGGVLTTPLTLNATIADGEQDLLVNVPTNTTIIPVYIAVDFEDTGTAQVLDVLAVASDIYDNANTSTAKTIYNMRIDQPAASRCSAMAVVTAGGTAVETSSHFVEFWRPYAGFGEDAFNSSTGWVNSAVNGCHWSVAQAVVPPIIVGPGSLSVFASAQAGTGFITAIWVEIPSAELV